MTSHFPNFEIGFLFELGNCRRFVLYTSAFIFFQLFWLSQLKTNVKDGKVPSDILGSLETSACKIKMHIDHQKQTNQHASDQRRQRSTYCARSGGQNIGTTATTIGRTILLKVGAYNLSYEEVTLLIEYAHKQ